LAANAAVARHYGQAHRFEAAMRSYDNSVDGPNAANAGPVTLPDLPKKRWFETQRWLNRYVSLPRVFRMLMNFIYITD
jgi:hypothetical protein